MIKLLSIFFLFLVSSAYGEQCGVLFQEVTDDQSKIFNLLRKDFDDDLEIFYTFSTLSKKDSALFAKTISTYDYASFRIAVEHLKDTPSLYEVEGAFNAKLFLLDIARPGYAAERYTRKINWRFKGEEHFFPLPEFKAGYIVSQEEKNMRDALEMARKLLDTPQKVYGYMQEFEDAMMLECLANDSKYFQRSLSEQFAIRQKAIEKILGEQEILHGFKSTSRHEYSPLILENKTYSMEEWLKMLREGHAFNDSNFIPDEDTSKLATFIQSEQGRGSHGYYTHRIQFYVLMREMDKHPDRFHHLKASDLLKKMGDFQFNRKLGMANDSDDTLWQMIFDSFGNSYNGPEFFRSTHNDYPYLGSWL